MHNCSINFDILGFIEIRFVSHLCLLYDIPGYHMFTRSRNSHGGGVALHISTNYYDTGTQNQLRISESFIETIGIETTMGYL